MHAKYRTRAPSDSRARESSSLVRETTTMAARDGHQHHMVFGLQPVGLGWMGTAVGVQRHVRRPSCGSKSILRLGELYKVITNLPKQGACLRRRRRSSSCCSCCRHCPDQNDMTVRGPFCCSASPAFDRLRPMLPTSRRRAAATPINTTAIQVVN